MVDAAEEGATEVVVAVAVTVDPHRTTTLAVDPAFALGEGRPDRGADEGQDGEGVIVLAILRIHALRVDHLDEVGAAVGGELLDADGLEAEPLAEGVGGVEGLGTHGLAEVASSSLGVVGLVILVGEDGLCERRGYEEVL